MLMLLLLALATAKSSLPSPLKSPTAAESGPEPAGNADVALSATEEVGLVISKKIALEVPPPGVGLKTVTEAVLNLATSLARMAAVSFELLTKVVARAPPFHFTVEPDTKPVPSTVSLKANPPPGSMAAGLKGW